MPPLPPDTIGYNDAEFRNSDGPRFHGAATAWVGGHTGQDSVIAVIDTGIDSDSPEFAGRISPDSTDLFSSRGTIEGEDDHGTLVSMVAAAANDGQGIVGIAYSSTILMIRADEPGTCASPDDCAFGDISAGIDWAVDHGATVINLSLGGSSASRAEIDAVRRAADAGVIVVIAAGNDGTARPDPFARGLTDIGTDNVIIAGSVNSAGVLSDFSNGARTRDDYYLAALGEDICCVYENGHIYVDGDGYSYVVSGTSFSAPQIAGAVALLKQAFPNLTGAQIVELLFSTAQDVGAPGIDDVYGHGILDIRAAFQPQGKTTLADTGTAALALNDTSAVGSPAMGDALGHATLSTVILDKYRRAYNYDLALSMRGATLPTRLYNAIGSETRSVSGGNEKASVAFTIDRSHNSSAPGATAPGSAAQLMLSQEDAQAARVLAARIALRISPKTQLGFAYAEAPDGLAMQLQGQDRPAFLIARGAGSDDGTLRRTDMSVALRRQFGQWGLTITGESGAAYSGNGLWLNHQIVGSRTEDPVRDIGLALDRKWGGIEATLGLDWMNEQRTVLGARFHEAFGGGGANTLFVDADAAWEFAPGWRLHGALRNGWTYPAASSVIEGSSVIRSRAWSFDLERRGVFGSRDSLGLRLAQPLRVESGGLDLYLPVGYSYDTESATFGTVPLALAPDGRELMGEFAWRGPLWGGSASASVFYRRDPGHYEDVPDDAGVAIRWTTGF